MRARGGRVLLFLVAVGCGPSLSTFQPAHVMPRGGVAANAGLEVGVPVGAIGALYDTGKALAERGSTQPLTDDEKWQVFDAGVNLMLSTPSFGPFFGAAYAPLDRLEVGLRYAGVAWRSGARYQLLDRRDGPCDLSVGLGVSRFTFDVPLADQIPALRIDDFSRWQVDVPMLAGTSRDWLRVWAGPKLLFTTFETQLALTLSDGQTVARFDGTATFVGGQAGIAFGYRKLFLGVELTIVEAFGTARLTSPTLNPGTHDTSLSGLTIFPSVGLLGEI